MIKIFFKQLDLAKIFVFLAAIFLFGIKGKADLDPDFGWHYKMGELILQKGIPKTDPFSYTMPSFPFIDHEWLTNVSYFWIFGQVGFVGLGFISSFAVLFSLLISTEILTKSDKGSLHVYWKRGLFLLMVISLLPFSGIRPQVFSWLFLSILLFLILNRNINNKSLFFLPFLFLLWVNLHGSFSMGIGALVLFFILKFLRLKKIIIFLLPVIILCIIATFINPYGPGIWKEVWMQVSDTALRWRIQEWQPSFFYPNFSFLFLLSFSGIFIFRYRRKFLLEEIGLFLAFLYLSLSSVRHVPLWIILNSYFFSKCLIFLKEEADDVKFGSERMKKISIYFFVICFIVFLVTTLRSIYWFLNSANQGFYPQKAIIFLQNNSGPGEIFSQYGWGGYLIWKYPDKKVFIDGRMPSWRWKKNPKNESSFAMEDYLSLLNGEKNYKKIFSQYNITRVLWPVEDLEKTPKPINFIVKIDNFFCRFRKCKPKFDFLETLIKDGWKEIYKDNIAVIYTIQ